MGASRFYDKALAYFVSTCILVAVASAQAVEKPAQKRARPPKWTREVLDVFFDDARQQLVGEHPSYGNTSSDGSNSSAGSVNVTTNTSAKAATPWSKLIDAETIETEIKRLAQSVSEDVGTPSEFKGGKYQDCRRHFSLLAMLFAVTKDYDGDARWQDAAGGLRDLFARAGYNCKVGTDQTYREATLRNQDLADLVRGARPEVPPAEAAVQWGQISDRPPLMQRINTAHEDRLIQWLANERQFVQHRDEVRHESQLVAVVADVIAREGFEFWDDGTYAQYARDLKQAAGDVSAAAAANNYSQARDAGARISKACADCHDGYRG